MGGFYKKVPSDFRKTLRDIFSTKSLRQDLNPGQGGGVDFKIDLYLKDWALVFKKEEECGKTTQCFAILVLLFHRAPPLTYKRTRINQ